jgi:hypothetical protein
VKEPSKAQAVNIILLCKKKLAEAKTEQEKLSLYKQIEKQQKILRASPPVVINKVEMNPKTRPPLPKKVLVQRAKTEKNGQVLEAIVHIHNESERLIAKKYLKDPRYWQNLAYSWQYLIDMYDGDLSKSEPSNIPDEIRNENNYKRRFLKGRRKINIKRPSQKVKDKININLNRIKRTVIISGGYIPEKQSLVIIKDIE